MKLIFTDRFKANYTKLDAKSQNVIDKAISLLSVNPKHPSLRTKKIKGTGYIFEASANMDIRITFHYKKPNLLILRNCGHHDRTLSNP